MSEYVADDVHVHADRYGGWSFSWTAPDGTKMEVAFVPASVDAMLKSLGIVRMDAVVEAFKRRGLIRGDEDR